MVPASQQRKGTEMKPMLLSTSPTLDGITASVRRYLLNGKVVLISSGEPEVWNVVDGKDGGTYASYRVVLKGGRYRFEDLRGEP